MKNLEFMSILRQGQWTMEDTIHSMGRVAEQGFTHILVGPYQGLKEDYTLETCPWWGPYQPTSLKVGNIYGDEKTAERMNREAERYGIKMILDKVITHTAQSGAGSPLPHERVDPRLLKNPYFWRPPVLLNGPEYDNRSLVTHFCAGGLPALNLYNWELQDEIIQSFEEDRNLGFEYFRIDSGKNIPLPTETYHRAEIEQKIRNNTPAIDNFYLNDAFCDSNPCPFLDRLRDHFAKKKVSLIPIFEVLNVWSGWLFNQYAEYGYVFSDCRDHPHPKAIVSPETHDQYWNPDPHHQNQGAVSNMPDYTLSQSYLSLSRVRDYLLWNSRPFSEEWSGENIQKANEILREKVYYKERKIS